MQPQYQDFTSSMPPQQPPQRRSFWAGRNARIVIIVLVVAVIAVIIAGITAGSSKKQQDDIMSLAFTKHNATQSYAMFSPNITRHKSADDWKKDVTEYEKLYSSYTLAKTESETDSVTGTVKTYYIYSLANKDTNNKDISAAMITVSQPKKGDLEVIDFEVRTTKQ